MAGRFPDAPNLRTFWHNLTNGVESLTPLTDEELLDAGVPRGLIADPDYVKQCTYLEGADRFDASFFGFNAREAEILDPQQRVFLECAWEAIEDAGYVCDQYPGAVSVFAGASINTYLLANLLANRAVLETVGGYQTMVSNDKDFLATRVSYKLNLRGPALTVQTACSTSLVAVQLAWQSLITGQSDLALAGGVSVNFPQKVGYLYSEGMIFSPDGHCRPFDEKGQGIRGGAGAGVVVLKRLQDAIADRDPIRAVLLGAAINNDGSDKMGYTAPSMDGQAAVIAMAQRNANVDPGTITYIEAHGTATPLGDPIEVGALSQVFRAGTTRREFCALGSVKSNLGHLDAAAGIAGLTKTVLSLQHGMIPPSINFERPNPQIDFHNSPFYVNDKLSEWKANGHPLRAGVSSFGIGGTNAHVVLEEAPLREASVVGRPAHLLVLSARTASALDVAASNLAAHLSAHPDMELADVAYTLQVGRKRFDHRRAVVARNRADAIAALSQPDRNTLSVVEHLDRPSVAFLFSGQGSQYAGMGRELYDAEPTFREEIDRCAELLMPYLGRDIRELMFAVDTADAASEINQTQFAQPALFVFEYALARTWMAWGIRPAAMIGHSIGEYVAACVSGVLSLDDALRLVAERGRLMQAMPPGRMVAVPLSQGEIMPYLNEQMTSASAANGSHTNGSHTNGSNANASGANASDQNVSTANAHVELAAVNAPRLSVVAGPDDAIARFEQRLAERGIECRALHTSHAFHSAMMEPALPPFLKAVRGLTLGAPTIPYLSNLTGTWVTAAETTRPEYWAEHLRNTVRFADGVLELTKTPNMVLLEVGPGKTLATLARQTVGFTGQEILHSVPHPLDERPALDVMLQALGQLWVACADVSWENVHRCEQLHRVSLPTYPFERQRYLVEPQLQEFVSPISSLQKERDITNWIYAPSWQRVPRHMDTGATIPSGDGRVWLVFMDDYGVGVRVAERLVGAGHSCLAIRPGDAYAANGNEYIVRPGHLEDYEQLMADVSASGARLGHIVHLWSVKPLEGDPTFDAALDTGFFSVVNIARAASESVLAEPITLTVVTTGVQRVLGNEPLDLIRSSVLGPVKVIPHEIPTIHSRSIDIQLDEATDDLIDALVVDMATSTEHGDFAYRAGQRWTERFTPMPIGPREGTPTELREGGVYLVTGGLGALGLVLARFLAETVHAKLVLVGRSALPARDEWSQWLLEHGADDATSGRIQAIQELESMGAEVLVGHADISDLEAMQQVVTDARERFGTVHGVFHAAGLPGGTLIQLHSRQDAMDVMAPKVRGTLVLDALFRGSDLDFMVLFSSINTIAGFLGGSDYTAANVFLDRYAMATASSTWRVLSINWDAWQDIGMAAIASAAFSQNTGKRGLSHGIKPSEGIEALRRVLGVRIPRVSVITRDVTRVIEWSYWLSSDIRSHQVGQVSQAAPRTLSQHARPELAQDFVEPATEDERFVADLWRELLGIEQVGANDNFFELGGHSLIATGMLARILKERQVKLPLRTIFEAPTVRELAERIESVAWAVQPVAVSADEESREQFEI
jgi:acyl transferase domain-containing protein